MKRVLLTLASMAAIFLGGCADDLSPDRTDKPPAPYSPDPSSHVPAPSSDTRTERI